MTTIAFDGRFVAADTLVHRNGNRANDDHRKLILSDGFVYAVNGDWGPVAERLIQWHQNGANPDCIPKWGLGSLTIVELASRRVWAVSGPEMPFLVLESAPWATGSGHDLALGAMGAGVSAMRAVQIAARWDIHTGPLVDYIDLDAAEPAVQRWHGQVRAITKPRKPADGWADACTGLLVLGTGCGKCLRCNREWYAIARQTGDDGKGAEIVLTEADVRAQQMTAAPSVAQPAGWEHAWNHGKLAGWVHAWNQAVIVGDAHKARMLEVQLREITFPPDVVLVDYWDVQRGKWLKQVEDAAPPIA